MVLVAVGGSRAADRRPAITMAWEWGAMGLLYLMVRNLPRAGEKSATLAGAVVATAVAVAAYELYQVPVEFAQIRARSSESAQPAQPGDHARHPLGGSVPGRLVDSEQAVLDLRPCELAGRFSRRPARALAFAVAARRA